MNKTKKPIIIIASIVVFAGLIGGIVFLVGMLRNKTAEQEVIVYPSPSLSSKRSPSGVMVS